MIGNHSVSVIAEAYKKGFRGFDAEKAFDAIKQTLTVSHPKSDWETYMKYGSPKLATTALPVADASFTFFL